MSYGVIVPNVIQAQDIDALVRSAKSATAVENGFVGQLATMSAVAGEREVFVMTAPSASAGLTNLWMVGEPEVVVTTSGSSKYKGIDPDPRNFIVAIGDIFTVFQPKVGDIITMSADALVGSSVTGNYVVATATDFQLNWAAAAVSGLSLKLLETTYISIADGSIGNQRVTAYRFEVVAVA